MIKGICSALIAYCSAVGLAQTTVPHSAFFLGYGGAYNAVKLQQDVNAYSGITNIYNEAGQLVAYGQAGGPAPTYYNTQHTMAPLVQMGYFHQIEASHFFWGAKFLYQYVNSDAKHSPVRIPQGGSFTNVGGDPGTNLTGNVVVRAIKSTMNHEFTLLPFAAYSFQHSLLYFGAGPSLFYTKSRIDDGRGYANINGNHAELTGSAVSFSNSNWVWGVSAQLGLDYFISPRFFVDVNYMFGITQHYTIKNSGAFNDRFRGGNGDFYSDTGIFYINNAERQIVQSVLFSVNFKI